jgi:hypothetical protein
VVFRAMLRTRRSAAVVTSLVMATASLPTLLSVTVGAGATVVMRASPNRAFAPADINVSVSIESDENNRAMTVTLESTTFLRESTIELEGHAAPRTSYFRFRAMPAGDYEVRVQLFDARRHERGWARRLVSLA